MFDPSVLSGAEERLRILLGGGDIDAAAALIRALHPADGADQLDALEPEDQALVLPHLSDEEIADLLSELYEESMVGVVKQLARGRVPAVLDNMDADVAADYLGQLDPEEQAVLLAQMQNADDVRTLLPYSEDSAGGIMSSARHMARNMLRRHMTVGEAVAFLQRHYQDEQDLYYLYVLDRHRRLVGIVSLRTLVLAHAQQTLGEIMDQNLITISPEMDQEEVAQLFARYHLLALPVVDAQRRLLGIVTVDDAVEVIQEEATEDIYRLAQVSEDSGIYTPLPRAIRSRLSWLTVNLGTAFLASAVVGLFQDVIAQAAVLAVFMPIVAGQGGNAGTQTLTIVVRSLALGELALSDAWVALRHEVVIGTVNGFAIGTLVGVVAWLWKQSPILGVVIGCAMVGNMIVAALAGTLVPLVLKVLNVDPALASSIFVTTFTDVCGFALFLGLGLYFLPYLR